MTAETDANNPIPKITRDDEAAGSGDLVRENVERLKALFPQIVTDGKVDFDVLRQLLGDEVEEGEERYGLNWKGKRRARAFAMTPSLGTLRPAPEDSVDWDTTQNLMIEGDNLEVLKLLRRSYAGKVKLIYIDPPYNTGNDFIYRDDYRDPLSNYMRLVGNVSDSGAPLTSDPDAGGRFHTNWLNMMYPRLFLAKDLLREDGFIFISADQNEVAHLRQLCDEIFGYENRAAEIAVVNNLKGRNDRANVAITHEFLIAYGKSSRSIMNGIPLTEEQRAEFKFNDEKFGAYALRDLRKRGRPDRREDRPNMWFPIYWNQRDRVARLQRMDEDDIEVTPLRGDGSDGRWRWGKERVAANIEHIEARQSRTGRWDFDYRVYLNPPLNGSNGGDEDEDEDEEQSIERSSKPKSIWTGPEFSTDVGRRTVKELMPGGEFSYPKPVGFLQRILQLGSSEGDLVIDFFAGSGTTGHAALSEAAERYTGRRYILVQLPETLSEADKEQRLAAKFCLSLGRPLNIAELTKERLRRAGQKIRAEHPGAKVDTGFRVYKLATSNLKPWQPDPDNLEASILDAVDNVLPDRTEHDLLVELLLKTGIDLTMPEDRRMIAGQTVHALGGGALMVCLGNIGPDDAETLGQGMADWLDELDPTQTTIYFKDVGLGTDNNRSATKANLAAILRQRHGDRIAKIASI